MGFYGKQPVNENKCTATYVWTGLNGPGFFSVKVEGDAQNYSYGFDLKRDPHFAGGLKINSMGWTGPLGKGTTPYADKATFPGEFREKIVISGSNGDFLINVEQIPHDKVEAYVKAQNA